MELSDLVGEHDLTAVEDNTEPTEYGETASALYFTLDGKTYKVTEDPDDGYRSSMRDIEVSDRVLANSFAPCRVVARYIDGPRNYAGANHLLECVDVVTGKTVLLVGTENTDDYYPSFVAAFTPENMARNVSRQS